MNKNIVVTAALLGAVAVLLGAFAAHTLKNLIETKSLMVFETAVRYQFYHTFSILIAYLFAQRNQVQLPQIKWSIRFFFAGIALFSGSLYLISTSELSGIDTGWIGPVTPLGGICFLLGWIFLAVSFFQKKESIPASNQE